jgi:hypothetical protein
MKNISKFIIAAFILSVFFMGCKKDDDSPKNHMTYNDTEYDLSQGVLENYGQVDRSSVYNFDLVLLSSGFVIHDLSNEFDSLSGKGHGIVFELFTSDANKLAVGDYVYDATESKSAGTFDYANGVLDYDMETEEGTEFEINGGKLTVVQSGDVYELNFDCTTYDGKSITGFYKGSLKYYSYQVGFKSPQKATKDKHFK